MAVIKVDGGITVCLLYVIKFITDKLPMPPSASRPSQRFLRYSLGGNNLDALASTSPFLI